MEPQPPIIAVTPNAAPRFDAFVTNVLNRVGQLRGFLEVRAEDGKPSSNDVFSLGATELNAFIRSATGLDLSGAAKKQLVSWAAVLLIDALVPLIPLGWFSILGAFVRPAIRRVLYWLSDGAIEFFYREQKTATQAVSEAP